MSDVQPSVPLIAYLFADRLLPPRTGRSHGIHVPCTNEHVQLESLAILLFSAAFWSLREQGLIALHVVEHPSARWPVHHSDVSLERLDGATRPGLEGAVMENLGGEATLCDVVYGWSSQHTNNPWHDVIQEVVDEALIAGYLHSASENTGVLGRLLGHGTELESDCSKIADVEEDFSRFHELWRDFRANESPLCEHLTSECKRALLTCTERWYP